MNHTPKPSELIGTTGLAAELAVDTSTVKRWVDRGLIEPVGKLAGPNGAYIFNRAEVCRAKAAGLTSRPRTEARTGVAR